MNLRCSSKLHGVVLDGHVLQVKCSSRFCGAAPGVVVMHYFDLKTGEQHTSAFKDAARKGDRHAAAHSAAVRAS